MKQNVHTKRQIVSIYWTPQIPIYNNGSRGKVKAEEK